MYAICIFAGYAKLRKRDCFAQNARNDVLGQKREVVVPMNKIRQYQVLLMITVMIFASLACNYARRNAAQSLELDPQSTLSIDGLEDVPIDSQGGLRLVVTEAQLTSLIAEEIGSQENAVLLEPRISLRNGQMVLTGIIQQSGLNADLEMIMDVGVSPDGKPDVTLLSATVGLFSLPQDMLENISAQIKSAFESKIDQGIDKIFIDSITIEAGEMVIQGHAR